MINHIRVAFILLCFLFSSASYGSELFFRTLGVNDGLSQPSSISIWQDGLGRIWIGNDAVNCYDGSSVKVFRLSEYFSTVEDTNIHHLCGNDSVVYLLAEKKIICIDLITNELTLTDIVASAICVYEDSLYAIDENSLFTYNYKTKEKEILFIDNKCSFKLFAPIDESSFWIGTTNGVLKVDTNKKSIISYLLEKENISSLFLDSSKNLWLGTESRTVAFIPFDNEMEAVVKSSNKSLPFIHCFAEDHNSTIWIGTIEGVYKVKIDSNGNPQLDLKTPFMQEKSITSLCVDRQGTLWIGPYYGDICYGNMDLNDFNYYISDERASDRLHGVVIGSMTEDNKGNLYVATEGSGINVIDKNKNIIEYITTKSHQLPSNKIRTLWFDQDKERLFIGAYNGGLIILDRKTNDLKKVKFPDLPSDFQPTIENIIPYKDMLVLHTRNGIFKLNKQTLQVSYFLSDPILRHKCSGNIRTIYIDDRDRLWVSSLEEGLFNVDLKKQIVLSTFGDGLSDDCIIPSAVNAICGDTWGGIFLSTLNSGFLRYVEENDSFESYSEQDNFLLSDICYRVIKYSANNLIVTTNKGVSILEISSKKELSVVSHIHLNDLFQINAISQDCGVYVSQYTQDIYVGALYGMFSFKKHKINRWDANYSLFFSSIIINNKKVYPGESKFLDNNIEFSREVILPYDQNTLSLGFTTTNYILSNYTQYEYKMQGLDDLWITAHGNTITYPSLRPGKYKLMVRELGNPLKETFLDVTIKHPFWLSIPMLILYSIFFIVIIYGIINFNRTKFLLKTSLEIKKKEIERMEKMEQEKHLFLTNITNEFRTPLTIIITLLNRILAEENFTEKSKVGKILKQALYLQNLIAQLLKYNNEDTKVFSLETGDLQKIKEELVLEAEEKSTESPYSILIVDGDEETRKVLKELFSYAYQLLEANSGEEGYLLAIKRKPDIILSEIDISGISGIELCKMLKSNIETLHIPIILMTHRPSKERQIQSFHAGADYIVKPFQVDLLLHRCNSLVRINKQLLSKYVNYRKEENSTALLAINERRKKFLEDAVRILENNLDNTEFDINFWSKNIGVSRTNLFNQIKSITGMTPNEYILSFKIDKAKALLTEDASCQIAEIAYRLGYSDPVYFSRTFKRIVGISPQQYRKKMFLRDA